MIHQMFAIYDSKAKAYLPPFIYHRNEMAIRTFSDCINNPDHQFHHNPDDYTLFTIGEYNDEKGQVTKSLNVSLGNGVEFIRPLEMPFPDTEFDLGARIHTDPPIGNIGKTNSQDET